MSEAIAEIGHNSGETELSQFEQFSQRTDELVQGVDRFAVLVKDGIQDDAMADKAANFRSQIKGQINLLGKARTADKKPHLEAGRQVDTDYKSIISPLDAAILIINKPLLVYTQKKEAIRQAELQAQHEEQARKDAEAKAAMEKAQESENLADKVAADKAAAEADQATEAVEKTQVEKTVFGKSPVNGRATGVRMVTVTSAKVTDSQKAVAKFHAHPDVIAVMEKIATDLFKQDADLEIEGISRVETDKLR